MDVQKLKNESGLKGSSSGEIASALRNFGQAASNSVAETVSAPIDAITWALRKAGMPIDKPVMGSDWMAEKGLTRPTQEGASKLAGEFVGMVSPLAFEKSVATQLAGALRNVKPSAGLSTEAVGGMEFLNPSSLSKEDAFRNMTKEQFLGNPKITGNANAADLVPRAYPSVQIAEPQPFLGGKYQTKMSDDGAEVFDKDKVIASYNNGDTLVVDKNYRRNGIGQELVYQWRKAYPAPAATKYRTKASQAIQEKVWDRIKSESNPSIMSQDYGS